MHNLHARELISDQKMSQAQQQRPKSPMVTCGVFTLQAQVTYGYLRSFYLAGPSHLWLLAEFLPCRPKSPMVACGVFTLQAQVTYGYLRSFYLAGPRHLWLLAEFLPCRPKSPMVTCGVFILQAQVTYGNLHLQGKNSTKNSRSVELCTIGDSGLC